MIKFLRVLFQRLVSFDWKTAGAELSVLGLALTAIIVDVQKKNFMALLADVPAFWTPVGLFIGAFRMTISSNEKAIENPMLPQITGVAPRSPLPY